MIFQVQVLLEAVSLFLIFCGKASYKIIGKMINLEIPKINL